MLKGKLFGRKTPAESPLAKKIAGWTLTDMQNYLRGLNTEHPLSEAGVMEVLKKLHARQKPDNKYPEGKRHVEAGDNDAKIKKLFDVLLAAAKSPKPTPERLELLVQLLEAYSDLVTAYDRNHKEIYGERLNAQMHQAAVIIETKLQLNHKYDLLHSSGAKN